MKPEGIDRRIERRRPKTRRCGLAAAVAGIVLAAATAPLGAQERAEPSSLFVERMDVNLVNVEVVVTDNKGNRVTDLTVDDFEIFEDGRPMEITNFYATSRPEPAAADVDRAREPGGEQEARPVPPPAEAVPEDQRLSLVVYVDNLNIRPSHRGLVLQELDTFVEDRIARGDRLALLSYGRSVRTVVPLTTDMARWTDGLEEVSREVTYGQVTDALRHRVIRNLTNQEDSGAAYDLLRSFVAQRTEELRRSVDAFDSVVRSLSGLPGRKAVLYVSDGLPRQPGADLYEYYRQLFEQTGGGGGAKIGSLSAVLLDDQNDLFDGIVRRANGGGVTLHTLHAEGARVRPSVSAAYSPTSLSNGGDALADYRRLDNHQEPLGDMAAKTGGAAIFNTSNFGGAFEELSKDFDSLYSLGYPSDRDGDGEYRSIEVKVKRPGLEVRHRSGYVDKSEEVQVADRTFSSLIFGLESNPLGISVDFGEPEKAGRGKFHLPLLVRIPFEGVTLLQTGGAHEGRLRIHLAVQDAEGGVSKVQQIPFPVTVPEDQLADTQGKEMGYAGKLLVRDGVPRVAVGVWDEVSGSESFVHKSVQVGKNKKKKKKGGSP